MNQNSYFVPESVYRQEALRLLQGVGPQFNITPLVTLIKEAERYGLKLVPMKNGEMQERHLRAAHDYQATINQIRP